jgi:hypothetical protein
MGGVMRVRFRHNAAIAVAGLVAFFGALPLAATHWYLAPILLVPLTIGAWGALAGTDVDASGVYVRALFGRRRLPWDQITGFVHANRLVHVTLANGVEVPLPAVTAVDLPRLIEAGGQQLGEPLNASGPAGQPADQQDEPANPADQPADQHESKQAAQ